uniref:NADH-ubiquinone oxidoreductase chain 6 n=1 Tax=Potamanthus sp. MT-2014 TaxID=1560020 RepID=A0A0A0RYU0_9INSE|nr:NADH dehydrogenase subunit 6 [Potamanthus sp. MT-2014]
MLHLFLMVMVMSTGLLFCRTNHPLAMGLTLLFQTTLISLISGLMAPTFWFSYILFLVFLGGMLVLFIYVTSLASNEMFSVSAKAFLLSASLILGSFIITLITDPLLSLGTISHAIMSQSLETNVLPTLMFKFYNSYSSILTILLVTYLFLTLLAVVSITNIFQGPLRPSN